jgi:hypothetical protein
MLGHALIEHDDEHPAHHDAPYSLRMLRTQSTRRAHRDTPDV